MELSKRVREIMMEDRLMFVYRGVVTNQNSEALLLLLEKEMEQSEFGFVGRKGFLCLSWKVSRMCRVIAMVIYMM